MAEKGVFILFFQKKKNDKEKKLFRLKNRYFFCIRDCDRILSAINELSGLSEIVSLSR